MEPKQQPNEPLEVKVAREGRVEERKPRRLRVDLLEERAAPNAIWGE